MLHNQQEAVFVDDPTVPQFFIEGLERCEVRGSVCEIFPFAFRKTEGGLWIRQPSHTCIAPVAALPQMVAVVSRAIGLHMVGSARDATARVLRLQ
jgi:hypothetical protein